ncbi:MAG: NAD(P)/FAD-dependent oxidoreductase [Glaciimonas sp.]|nr:NAD(P)/FAD-dependent oxidoreductase [Glaciimonas sp.]
MTKHVIIGNGPAGVIAAEAIRKHAPQDAILLIGNEDIPPYSRMAIPYLLMGNIGEEGTFLRKDKDHFSRLRIEQQVGHVRHIDIPQRQVEFMDGSSVAFDKLLIATGSTPVRPPIPGIDCAGVHTCWNLQDARAIMTLARPKARVIQMGAGFIGCIIMEALAARGVELTVVEMGDRMVPRMMGEGAGNMIRRWCESKGVTVYTDTRIEAIEAADAKTDAPLRVRLSNGQHLPADLIISATGVRPHIAFLESGEIKCLQGVLVDETMQTNIPGIYAAGDCAEAFDFVSGHTLVSAIQPNAADQARCAGMNMAGRHAVQRGVTQINVLDTLGLISSSFGQWQGVPGGQRVELTDSGRFKYLRLEFDQDVLIGSNAIGHTQHIGVLRGLIQQRVGLGQWKDILLEDPTRLPEAYIACAQQQNAWQTAHCAK